MHKDTKRLLAPDILKTIWLLGIILVHTSIYTFDGIYQMDIDTPPLVMVIFSVLTYWGALFTIVACWVHVVAMYRRIQEGRDFFRATIYNSFVSFLFLIMLHFFYNFVFGVIQLEFDLGEHQYTVITALMRNGNLKDLSYTRLIDGSTFSIIAVCILVSGIIVYFKEKYNWQRYFVPSLYILSMGMLATSALRIQLYPLIERALLEKNYLMNLLYGVLIEKPYPILPYLSFGIIGTMIGYMDSKQYRIREIIYTLLSYVVILVPIAIQFIINNEISIATVDWFWVGRLLIELSIFCIAISIALVVYKRREYTQESGFFKRRIYLISTYILTIYMLQPMVSEILRRCWFLFNTDWTYSVNLSIVFGVFNVLFWFIFVIYLPLLPPQVTFEYWWVRWNNLWKRESRKEAFLHQPNLQNTSR